MCKIYSFTVFHGKSIEEYYHQYTLLMYNTHTSFERLTSLLNKVFYFQIILVQFAQRWYVVLSRYICSLKYQIVRVLGGVQLQRERKKLIWASTFHLCVKTCVIYTQTHADTHTDTHIVFNSSHFYVNIVNCASSVSLYALAHPMHS